MEKIRCKKDGVAFVRRNHYPGVARMLESSSRSEKKMAFGKVACEISSNFFSNNAWTELGKSWFYEISLSKSNYMLLRDTTLANQCGTSNWNFLTRKYISRNWNWPTQTSLNLSIFKHFLKMIDFIEIDFIQVSSLASYVLIYCKLTTHDFFNLHTNHKTWD